MKAKEAMKATKGDKHEYWVKFWPTKGPDRWRLYSVEVTPDKVREIWKRVKKVIKKRRVLVILMLGLRD